MDPENRDHSFFTCHMVKNIWIDVAFLIGKRGIEEDECLSSFMD